MEILETILKLLGLAIGLALLTIIGLTILTFWVLLFMAAVVVEAFGSLNRLYSSPVENEKPYVLDMGIAETTIYVDGKEHDGEVWYQLTDLGKVLTVYAAFIGERDVTFDISDEEVDRLIAQIQEQHDVD